MSVDGNMKKYIIINNFIEKQCVLFHNIDVTAIMNFRVKENPSRSSWDNLSNMREILHNVSADFFRKS